MIRCGVRATRIYENLGFLAQSCGFLCISDFLLLCDMRSLSADHVRKHVRFQGSSVSGISRKPPPSIEELTLFRAEMQNRKVDPLLFHDARGNAFSRRSTGRREHPLVVQEVALKWATLTDKMLEDRTVGMRDPGEIGIWCTVRVGGQQCGPEIGDLDEFRP